MECAMVKPKPVLEKELVELSKDVCEFEACASPAVSEVEKTTFPADIGDGPLMNKHCFL